MKQNTMGYISSNEDRKVFEDRFSFLLSLAPWARTIAWEFENVFAGNLVNGFSFANILESFLIDYKSMLQNRSMDLSYWFTSQVATVYGNTAVNTPVEHNVLFSKDTRYKALIRTDGKLAPFNYVISRYNVSATINFLKFYAVTLKNVIPSNFNNPHPISISSIGKTSGSPLITNIGTNLGLFYVSTGEIKSPGTVNWKDNENFGIYGSVEYYLQSNGTYNTRNVTLSTLSPNQFITIVQDLIAVIRFLESDNNALNIDGNYDGLAANKYETILNDQLSYLNNITDAVTSSLINEKVDFQGQKDSLKAQIEQKKKDVQNAITNKKASIKKLNEIVMQYEQLKG